MSTEAPTPRYRLDPHARFRVMDDEGIFVLRDADEVLVVNRVGAFTVEKLKADQSLDEVVTALLELAYACNLDCGSCYNDLALGGRLLSLAQQRLLLVELASFGALNL